MADFYCGVRAEEYELKAKKNRRGCEGLDGAYATMTARLAARNNPSLMVMSYDGGRSRVTDLIVVPRHVFVGVDHRAEDPDLAQDALIFSQ